MGKAFLITGLVIAFFYGIRCFGGLLRNFNFSNLTLNQDEFSVILLVFLAASVALSGIFLSELLRYYDRRQTVGRGGKIYG